MADRDAGNIDVVEQLRILEGASVPAAEAEDAEPVPPAQAAFITSPRMIPVSWQVCMDGSSRRTTSAAPR